MWKISTVFPVQLAVAEVKNITVTDNDKAFLNLLAQADILRKKYKGIPIGQVPGVQKARSLFHEIGIDPTKHRPSSEALLRRALKSIDFYRINSLVDTGNWCSLQFLLPICVYDAGRIEGDVEVRLGLENEAYYGHNDRVLNLHERLVIADKLGPFGAPITDSVRTAVTCETKNACLVIFASSDYESLLLREQAVIFAERAVDICGGDISSIDLIK